MLLQNINSHTHDIKKGYLHLLIYFGDLARSSAKGGDAAREWRQYSLVKLRILYPKSHD